MQVENKKMETNILFWIKLYVFFSFMILEVTSSILPKNNKCIGNAVEIMGICEQCPIGTIVDGSVCVLLKDYGFGNTHNNNDASDNKGT